MTVRPYGADLQKNFRDIMVTPGAPEVFDDGTPVLAVAEITLQRDSGLRLKVAQVGLPKPSVDQTLVNAIVQNVSTGATVYTVTTGKTFQCLGFVVATSSATGAVWDILVAGTSKLRGVTTALAVGGESHLSSPCPIFTATSGQVITVNHGFGATSGQVTIWGYEE